MIWKYIDIISRKKICVAAIVSVLIAICYFFYSIKSSPRLMSVSEEVRSQLFSGEELDCMLFPKSTTQDHTGHTLLRYDGYSLSFNQDTNCPDWVMWKSSALALRGPYFPKYTRSVDNNLPDGNRVSPDDYSGSGYDRGHMCPTTNLRWNASAFKSGFSMANVCPQNHKLNCGVWLELESLCDRLAKNGKHITIVCGPVYLLHTKNYIGKSVKVQVPDGFFKVILSNEGNNFKTIGFLFENSEREQDLFSSALPVDSIEKITGLQFFSYLPEKLVSQSKSVIDFEWWMQEASKSCTHHNIGNYGDEFYFTAIKYSPLYHLSLNCPGIKNPDSFTPLSRTDAISSEKRPCKLCCRDRYLGLSRKLPANDSIVNSRKEFSIFFNDVSKDSLIFYEGKFFDSLILAFILFLILITVILLFPSDQKSKLKSYKHDTKTISLFLQKFGKDIDLKYTTHEWDMPLYPNYDIFKEKYVKKLLKDKNEIRRLCDHLWRTVNNFLIDEGYDAWGRNEDFKIGYNKDLANWMRYNPNKWPGDMPISEFPEGSCPTTVDSRSLCYFKDVIDIFKAQIQFRDDKLFAMMLRMLRNHTRLNYSRQSLQSLKGKSIYTDTLLVERAIGIILSNMETRVEEGKENVEICCKVETDEDKISTVIELLHVNSFANTSLRSSRTFYAEKGTQSFDIRKNLENLCDVYVESIFQEDENLEFKPYRISILSSDKGPKYEPLDEDCKGYKVILKFYAYNE